MRRIFSAQYPLEVHEVRLFLESQGIDAKVFGDNSALVTGFAFNPAAEPGVFVKEADADRAMDLVQQFMEQPRDDIGTQTWTCPKCGTKVEEQFDACWKCGSLQGDVPLDEVSPVVEPALVATEGDGLTALSGNQDGAERDLTSTGRWDLWLDVAVVLSVAWLPYVSSCILNWFAANDRTAQSFLLISASHIIGNLSVAVVILYVIYRGDSPWATYGIKRPRPLSDILLGLMVWIVAMMVRTTAWVLIYRFASTISDTAAVHSYLKSTYTFVGPQGSLEYAVLVFRCLNNGFSEKLAMCAFLIPRFERLLGSSSQNVLLSSGLFASYHIYQGIGATIMIFVVGIVLGVVFCRMRRLWPVVVSHTLTNFVAYAFLN